eukprot:TRINITY_DN61252_c0_g1_i1.p1 TRINITY_DN61252_c0_g1~~TRINITY_DN61252_c0_g1_i1.p1  ORF type:complete len:501 (-),score=13.07 TRINITY_DN61252_c0_g1_i1:92-1594(-)
MAEKSHSLQAWKDEGKIVFGLAASVAIGEVANLLMQAMSIMFLGRIDNPNAIPASSLGVLLSNATGLAPGIGLCGALDTLISQDYGANKKSKRIGLHFQRGLTIMVVCSTTMAIIWCLVARPVFDLWVGGELAIEATHWLRAFSPALPAICINETIKRWMQCQNVVRPTMVCQGIGFLFNLFYNWLFVLRLGMGVTGSGLAQSASFWSITLVFVAFIKFKGYHRDTWTPWSLKVFKKWPQFFKLGIPACMMLMAEWLGFDANMWIASTLGPTPLAASSIVVSFMVITWMPALGLQIACCVRVGNQLGEGNLRGAKFSMKITYLMAICLGIFNCTLMITLHRIIPIIYDPEDQAVISTASSVLRPWIALLTLFDVVQAVTTGVFRGAGRQMMGLTLFLIMLWLVTLPSGVFVVYVLHLGVQGVWASMAFGMAVLTLMGLFIIYRLLNWEKVQTEAQARTAGATPSTADGASGDIFGGTDASDYGTFEEGGAEPKKSDSDPV